MQQGEASRAEPLCLKVLEVRRRVLGEENPDTLISMNNLAGAYRYEGKYAQAEPLLVKALAIKRRVLGEIHHSTATAWNGLATLYRLEGKLAEAEPLQLKAVEVWRAVSGDEGPETLTSARAAWRRCIKPRNDMRKPRMSGPKFWKIQRRTLGAKHPNTLDVMAIARRGGDPAGEVRARRAGVARSARQLGNGESQ